MGNKEYCVEVKTSCGRCYMMTVPCAGTAEQALNVVVNALQEKTFLFFWKCGSKDRTCVRCRGS